MFSSCRPLTHCCQDYVDTFLSEGKPVFNIEYEFDTSICDGANDLGIDTILKVRTRSLCIKTRSVACLRALPVPSVNVLFYGLHIYVPSYTGMYVVLY